MAELQQNFEGDESFNITSSNMPDDASDDTVAFMQVPQSHAEDQMVDDSDNSVNYEGTLADNLGEVADEEDTSRDIVDDRFLKVMQKIKWLMILIILLIMRELLPII